MSEGYDEQTPNPTSDSEDQFVRLKRWVIDGQRARSKWRVETKRAYDFVANHQWSEEDIEQLKGQHRPAVSFNRSAPIIKAVCGLEVNNRQNVVYLPRKQGDTGVDEVRTQAGRWARDLTDAEDEESEAFRDLAICGEGWTETRMDYDDVQEGRICEERVDPLEMGVNDGASRANYKDARCVYRIREMDSEDAKDLVGGEYEVAALNATWLEEDTPADGGEGNKKDYPAQTRAALERGTNKRTKVKLVQVQWWDREDRYMVAQDGVDKIQELTSGEYSTYAKRANEMKVADGKAAQQYMDDAEMHNSMLSDAGYVGTAPVPPTPTAPNYTHTKVKRKVFYQAFVGMKVLGEPEPIQFGEFQFKAMTGERDRKVKCFYGMMRDMFDPQMWANKWVSQTMHIMNTNAKGGIMAETDAFKDARKAEQDWADNTKIIWVKPGSLEKNKIKERTPPPLPQGLGELMQFALSSLRDVTGVNLELLGQADREQAASLEAQRRQSAMTILATLFNALRRYRKTQGRLMLKFIEMLPEGTLIGITDKGQRKYIPLVKQGDIAEYDVIIDEAPTSPDQKQAIWATTRDLLQSGLPLPPPAIMALLKYSPYPESVVQEISDAMGLGSDMPPEMMKQKLAQAEQALQVMEKALAQAQQDAKTAENDQAIELLKLEIDDYKAETARISAALAALSGKTPIDMATVTEAIKDNPPVEGVYGELTRQMSELHQLVAGFIAAQGQPVQQPLPLQPQ